MIKCVISVWKAPFLQNLEIIQTSQFNKKCTLYSHFVGADLNFVWYCIFLIYSRCEVIQSTGKFSSHLGPANTVTIEQEPIQLVLSLCLNPSVQVQYWHYWVPAMLTMPCQSLKGLHPKAKDWSTKVNSRFLSVGFLYCMLILAQYYFQLNSNLVIV